MIKSWKAAFLLVLGFAVFQAGKVDAQDSAPYQAWRGYSEGEAASDEGGARIIGRRSLSDWIIRPGDTDSKEGLGLNGPIGWEIYTMVGPSFPVSNGALAKNLQVGWDITGGGRSLFFNQEATKAWVLDVGVTNIFQNAKTRDPIVQVKNFGKQNFDNNFDPQIHDVRVYGKYTGPLALQYVNRTSANLSLGREWYLWGSAEEQDKADNFRFGIDIGGRWGSMKIQPVEVTMSTAIFGSLFGAFHADWEIPWMGVLWQHGVRLEIDQTWNKILQDQNNSDILSLNLLYRFGLRF
jgi:hypothetical protein